jgi:RNA-directed DNA polymerase
MSERDTDLVTPLVSVTNTETTAMPAMDTNGVAIRSGAVSGARIRAGDVDSVFDPPTLIVPSSRASTTATAIGITRATTIVPLRSADHYDTGLPVPFERAELVRAYRDTRKHKRNSASALEFEARLEYNLCRLYDELVSYEYKPGRSICFVVRHPRPREVWAADFRDRIVHRLMYNRIAPRFERRFIADTFACMEGRGTLHGVQRLESKVRSLTQNWSRPAYYLKADVANFFVSIDKNILWSLLFPLIHETWFKWVTETILFHDPRNDVEFRGDGFDLIPSHKRLMVQPDTCGLPIGNLSSQFFANVILNELDQFAKHRIGARHYVRYVDDFVILHESAPWLNNALGMVSDLLQERLGLRLNPAKTIIQPIPRGIDFVGQVVRPWRRTLRASTLNVAMTRLESMPPDKLFASGNSYFGLARQTTRGHTDRTRIAKLLLLRGHAVNWKLTKAYRNNQPQYNHRSNKP